MLDKLLEGIIDAEKMLADAMKNTGGAHPRLMLSNSDFDRIRTSEDPIYAKGRAWLLAEAEKLIEKQDGEYTQTLCRYEIPDGIRLLSTSRRVLDRVEKLALAYRIYGKSEYAQRAVDELMCAARFPDWNPYHFLDVGEMCLAFALGYDWLYDVLDEGVRSKLCCAMVEKGLRQVQADYRDYYRRRSYRWYQDMPGDNWKFICDGGITAAALAIFDAVEDERPLVLEVLDRAFRDAYAAVRNMYFEDGSYVEGFNYWNYATTYLAHYTCCLRSACGTDYGLTDHPGLLKSVYYVRGICSNGFKSFNFGDAGEADMCLPVLMWFGRIFSAGDVSTLRKQQLLSGEKAITVDDLVWYDQSLSGQIVDKELDVGSVGGANAAFRDSRDPLGFYAAIHFGNNGEPHGHADTGTFVLEWKGKRFFSDLGADNYNVPHYKYSYRFRAEGHNTLSLCGRGDRDQAPESKSALSRFESSDKCAIAVCDISEAYFGLPVIRGAKMLKKDKIFIVQDQIGAECDEELIWSAHTKGEIALSPDGLSAVVTLDGVNLYVKSVSGHTLRAEDAVLRDPSMVEAGQNDNGAYRKLTAKAKGGDTVCVAFCAEADAEAEMTEISEWSV